MNISPRDPPTSSDKVHARDSGEMLSGGEALIRALRDAGVEFVFGYPGGAVLHIYDALFRRRDVQHVLVRHEQAAVHMADGYARASGRPGVVLVTSGPGATNTLTGIATAYADSIPIVLLSGQVHSHLVGTDAFQETDMLGVSRPIVKYSLQVENPAVIPWTIAKAFHIACSGRPGPVVVDIPKDTTDPQVKVPYNYPGEVSLRTYNPSVRGHPRQVRKAVDLILQARRPVIYSGGGTVQSNAAPELRKLVDLLNFPITQTLMGLGAYPGTHERSLGMLGMHGCYEANMAMHHADLILAVGARFDDRVTNEPSKFCPEAKIIHIDVDPTSIAKIVPAEVPIVGSAHVVLRQIIDRLHEVSLKNPDLPSKSVLEDWWRRIKEWRRQGGLDHDQRHRKGGSGMILPQQVVQSLYRATAGKAFVTSDVGQHQMFAAQYYLFDEPRRWINSGGLGTMGFGLPAAMGLLFAYPDAVVACVTGEGSIQMNIQELSTCTQYGLPVKIINVNNQSLGMVRQWQDMQYDGRHAQSTYQDSLPDFVRLAESYGHVGISVSRLEDLEPAMTRVFSSELRDRLVFLDVLVDPDEHVYPMAVKGGGMHEMWLSKTEQV